MSISKQELKLKEKLKSYNLIISKRPEAIKILRKYIKENKNVSNEVWLELAFFIYHVVSDKYSLKKIRTNKKLKKEMNKAVDICKKVLKKEKLPNTKNAINARIFLAQIYGMLGNKKAIKLAKENFKLEKSALTANRVANIYDAFLPDFKNAEKWYKKYEKLSSKKENSGFRIHVATDLAIFYVNYKKIKKAKKYKKEAIKLINKIDNKIQKQSILNILEKNFSDVQ